MRYSIIAFGLAAVSAAALGQDAAAPAEAPATAWQFFTEDGGRNGASARNATGSQIVLKCDKPGRRAVHAIILAPEEKLAAPNSRPISRPIIFQFDSSAPKSENWGFFEHHAIALGNTSDRALARFVVGLRGASKVRIRLDTGISSDVVLDFDITGAQEAITRVYQTCSDAVPA